MKRQLLSVIAVVALTASVMATSKTHSPVVGRQTGYITDTTPSQNYPGMQDTSRRGKGKMKTKKHMSTDTSSTMAGSGDSTLRK